MNITDTIHKVRDGVYISQALIALFGVYLLIVMLRQLAKKRFASRAAATKFLDELKTHLQERNVDGVADICDSPAYWNKAVPQLVLVALQNPHLSPPKLRRLSGRDVRTRGAGRLRFPPVVDLHDRAGRSHAWLVGNGLGADCGL